MRNLVTMQMEHRATEDASSADEQAASAAAAAVAAAVAGSVAGSPRGSACATPPPATPYASSSGAATPLRDAPVRRRSLRPVTISLTHACRQEGFLHRRPPPSAVCMWGMLCECACGLS
jgi:hypothetical protein